VLSPDFVTECTASGNSKFAQHLLQNGHSFRPIEDMEIVRVIKKGGLMNTSEIFHFYNETRLDSQINDKCTAKPNILFDNPEQYR
jgi:hypothetical protein